MCGACGSTVYIDPVLGGEQTLRQRMLVAHIINSISAGVPGSPRIATTAEGWTATGPTGATTLCHTVENIWGAILERSRPQLIQQLTVQAMKAEAGSLTARVAGAGLRAAGERGLASARLLRSQVP